MESLELKEIVTLIISFLGSGALGHFLSETRQRKKDSSSDTHAIIDQLQENSAKQDQKILAQDEKIDALYQIISGLQEEVRETKTKKEQAEFWLSVEKETNKKLGEELSVKKLEGEALLLENKSLLAENERLRESISRLEATIKSLELQLKQNKEE